MTDLTAFANFAPTVIRTYRRNPEAFWVAVMAPFLTDRVSLLARLRQFRVGVELLSAFRDMDAEAGATLEQFTGRFGLNVTTWPSNRAQYFRDAYPVFAFLAVWMAEEGLGELVSRFDDILRAGVFAVAGYGAEDVIHSHNAAGAAALLRSDAARVRHTYLASKEMIEGAREILSRLEDRFLFRLVDITELRLERYFRRDLKMR